MKELPNMTDLFQAVINAQERLKAAENEERRARKVVTDRRNTYNEATKKFDEAIEALKKEAPWNTDWSRPQTERIE